MLTNQFRTLISAWKTHQYTQWKAADHRSLAYDRIAAEIAVKAAHCVQGGPYKGMHYFGPAGVPIVDQRPTTKLIGSFEEEIHPWIESLIARGFRQVIHIGGGEGYHAVGLLMRMPESRSIVFDTLIPARKACKMLARQNGVDGRMQLRGFCGTEGMQDLDLTDALVFADCGGAEITILDPCSYPALRNATILVETHDAFDNRITSRIRSRFASTHKIDFKCVADRDPLRYPFLMEFPPASAQLALDENRSLTADGNRQTWALLSPIVS
jgi:hypothetical protein